MHRFIDGEDRMQPALLPHCLEDYVDEENPVRVIEVFIDELDLAALGFSGMTPAATGRPAYHPSTLLKIYLYGYLNRIQSSRRLEREAQRNVELMWLTGRLAPDFKTIADFRKNNAVAIRAVCAQFVGLCRRLKLFTHAVVAIDGSKFKAVNNRDKNYTVAKVTGRMEQVNASISHYLRALDRTDREEGDVAEAKSIRLKEKIAGLRRQMQTLKVMEKAVQDAPDQQVSLTDPDARSMATSGKGTATVGYNGADRRRHRAPSDRGPRGDQSGVRPPPACAHGVQSATGHGLRADHCLGRPRLLQRRPGALVRRHGRRTCHAQDPDLWQYQSRPIHRAGFHLRRREGSLHLPGRPAPNQGAGPIRPLGRHRSIPSSDRLLHLSSQAAVHRRESEAGQALETRRRPRRHAASA